MPKIELEKIERAELRLLIERRRSKSPEGDPTFHDGVRWAEMMYRRLPMEDQAPDAPAFGIIDPDYARIFTIARVLAWSEGYALMFHGSFTRDLDLLAAPWAETACAPEHLVRRIADACDLTNISTKPGDKPHGRLAFTLVFPAFKDPRFVDLSIMPRFGKPESP